MYVDKYLDDYDYKPAQVLTQGISDWEEISEEDYNFIRANMNYLTNPNNFQGRYVLVAQPEGGAIQAINDIKALFLKYKKEEEDRKAENRRKAEEAKQRKLNKSKEKELKTLRELQEKYKEEIK